jgi:hypothetical protein
LFVTKLAESGKSGFTATSGGWVRQGKKVRETALLPHTANEISWRRNLGCRQEFSKFFFKYNEIANS